MLFKDFLLHELKEHIKQHDDVSIKFHCEYNFSMFKGETLTISDHPNITLTRGNENLYITMDIYIGESEKAYKLDIWSKENHEGVKEIMKSIINQI